MIRFLDIIISLASLILLSPIMLLISIWILIDTKSNPYYTQIRVGQFGKLFHIIKFRSMKPGSSKSGALTIGENDNRITRSGYFLRKFKLDEIPQLLNILVGQMSMVGPRPELPYFVKQYTEEQKKILLVKPGLTDEASLYYKNESSLLAQVSNPEQYFLEKIVPHKIELNQVFIANPSIQNYLRIILKTARLF